eukprot:SAG22_NODE_2010_length_3149_cov_1.351475_1_plen_530_part_00
MVMLHYCTWGISAVGAETTDPQWLWNGYLQVHNGEFFLLSAFGNWFSIARGMERARDKNASAPDYSPVVKTILLRGVLIMVLGMLATALFAGGDVVSFLVLGADGSHVHARDGTFLLRQLQKGVHAALYHPEVTPFIGFSTAAAGMIAFKIEVRMHGRGLRQKTHAMLLAILAVFVLGFIIRFGLDRATCNSAFPCVAGSKCQTWNLSEVSVPGVRMPKQCYVTHRPDARFVGDWTLPADISSCGHGDNASRSAAACDGDAQSPKPLPQANCLRGYPAGLNDDGFPAATLSDAQRGYRCCPVDVGSTGQTDAGFDADRVFHQPPGATSSTAQRLQLQCCLMTPWYGPTYGASAQPELLNQTTWLQKTAKVALFPLVGRYGFFSYGTISLSGIVLAMHVRTNGWTAGLFRAIWIVAIAGHVLVGPYAWFEFLKSPVGNEASQMAGTIFRLYIGSSETMLFGIFGSIMEARPTLGCYDYLRCCGIMGCCGKTADKYKGCGGSIRFKQTFVFRLIRRFGMVSFTVYHVQVRI